MDGVAATATSNVLQKKYTVTYIDAGNKKIYLCSAHGDEAATCYNCSPCSVGTRGFGVLSPSGDIRFQINDGTHYFDIKKWDKSYSVKTVEITISDPVSAYSKLKTPNNVYGWTINVNYYQYTDAAHTVANAKKLDAAPDKGGFYFFEVEITDNNGVEYKLLNKNRTGVTANGKKLVLADTDFAIRTNLITYDDNGSIWKFGTIDLDDGDLLILGAGYYALDTTNGSIYLDGKNVKDFRIFALNPSAETRYKVAEIDGTKLYLCSAGTKHTDTNCTTCGATWDVAHTSEGEGENTKNVATVTRNGKSMTFSVKKSMTFKGGEYNNGADYSTTNLGNDFYETTINAKLFYSTSEPYDAYNISYYASDSDSKIIEAGYYAWQITLPKSGISFLLPFTVEKAKLTLNNMPTSSLTKTYDGDTDVLDSVWKIQTTNLKTSDLKDGYKSVTVNSFEANYSSADVGYPSVTAVVTLGGTDCGNYKLVCDNQFYTITDNSDNKVKTFTITGLGGEITKKEIKVSNISIDLKNVTNKKKTYDGNTNISDGNKAIAKITSGVESGDDVSVIVSSCSFSTKKAEANKTIYASISLAGLDAGKYKLSSTTKTLTSASYEIEKKPISADKVTFTVTKTFDNTNSATLGTGSIDGSAYITGDDVKVIRTEPHTATYDNANAGENKTISISNGSWQLSGSDASNYKLADDFTAKMTVKGTITPKEVNISITNKTYVYDGQPKELNYTVTDSNGAPVTGFNIYYFKVDKDKDLISDKMTVNKMANEVGYYVYIITPDTVANVLDATNSIAGNYKRTGCTANMLNMVGIAGATYSNEEVKKNLAGDNNIGIMLVKSQSDSQKEITFDTHNVQKVFGDDKFTIGLSNPNAWNVDKTPNKDNSVEYTSDNTAVATVDKTTGEVTLTGAGTAHIFATSKTKDKDDVFDSYLLTVAEKTVYVAVKDQTVTYGEEAGKFDVVYYVNPDTKAPVTLNLDGCGAVKFDTSYAAGEKVGCYAVRPSGLTSAGYKFEYVDGEITVNPKKVDYPLWTDYRSFVYDTVEKTVVISDASENVDELNLSYINNKATNAGDYTVTATIGNTNYEWKNAADASYAWSVKKCAMDKDALAAYFTVSNCEARTYDGTAKAVTITPEAGITGYGTIVITYDGKTTVPTDAGTYEVKVSLKDATNFDDAEVVVCNLTINPKPVEIQWSKTDLVYNGEEQSVTATVKEADICTGDTVTVTVTNNKSTNINSATATATALSNANYKFAATAELNKAWTIEKKPVNVTWSETNLTYNGKEQSVTATVGDAYICGSDTVTVYMNGNTATNAGNYTASIDALSNYNYKLASDAKATKDWTIDQKLVTIKAKDQRVANGSTKIDETLTITGVVDGDTLYDAVEFKFQQDHKIVEDALSTDGTYDIYAGFTGWDDNYTFTVQSIGTLTVYTPSYNPVPSTPTSYDVTVAEVENGSVKVSKESSESGKTITVTLTADEGYEFDTLTVTKKNGTKLTLTTVTEGSEYTFVMPSSNVTVTAAFKAVETTEEEPTEEEPTVTFVDVPEDAYYAEAVAWAVQLGITNGVDDTHFDPNGTITRSQMVTFMWRAMGKPVVEVEMPFTDVAADAYYYEAVKWAVSAKITKGTSETTFSPDAPLTRDQAVTFLWRLAGEVAVDQGVTFTDVDADAFYASAVSWAAANGITNGTSETTFSPSNECLRAQIITFLYRYMKK